MKTTTTAGRKTETAPITWKQAQTLVKALQADSNHNTALLFASGFYFGLRISDILRLTWSQITADRFDLVEQKTGKTRSITVHDDFKKIVRAALADMGTTLKPSAFVFTSQRSEGNQARPITVIAANKRIKNAFDQYGVNAQNPSSHTMRKTFGRRVFENNQQSEAALILLGQIFNHRDTSTTRRYIGLTSERISNAYLSL